MIKPLEVAIVHDNFAQMGGAERVVASLSAVFPDADLLSTLAVRSRLSRDLSRRHIQTTWMQHLPGIERYYRHYFLLYPLAIETMNVSRYDVIISSCFGYAKGIRRGPNATHICYCHTPPRWIWRYEDYSARERFGYMKRNALSLLLNRLKPWDLKASLQPDYYIANSNVVAERIRKYYNRESVVIPPPINTARFTPSTDIKDYYLVVSRLTAYKRIDLAIEACNLLKRHLVIIGTGPDRVRLGRLAGPTIEFLERQPDDIVSQRLSSCRALILSGEEDFGMVPLEANAAGRPVIAFRAGGALETVIDERTGVFFNKPTACSLAEAIEHLEACSWSTSEVRHHSEQFSEEVFSQRVSDFVAQVVPGARDKHIGHSGRKALNLHNVIDQLSLKAN